MMKNVDQYQKAIWKAFTKGENALLKELYATTKDLPVEQAEQVFENNFISQIEQRIEDLSELLNEWLDGRETT